ncbi:TonB-dependent receptor [Pseudoxanthomonas sp.]|jgi:Outer membrane cobalamin receptor protein|uniref:TonB-dependent receptor plug domain-containing protein n=1 Tax=Pseudoxanthomonas sp. TaxID=1871049 RepID=UPI002FE0B127
MNHKTNKLREAIGFVLAVGVTSAAGSGAAFAQEAASDAKNLDTVRVTGSRVARVETETASPVVIIDRAAIEQTGKLTLGDLLQEMPAISGAPTNPQVNNGGGDGASTIDLRGLGSQRTLVLVNGRRTVNNDINSIPATAVERIEILTSGASAVYGSDAVAGVVNFILRRDFEGLTASVDFGITPSHQDGQRTGASVTFGQVGEKGNIIAGINYNQFDGVSSADRDFSKDATYLYSGYVTILGSSRAPRGRIYLPSGNSFNCSSVTRIEGASGASLGDYRCYSGATDSYNYQATNLIVTPQERSNVFFLANYQIGENLNAFAEVYHNRTTSNFAIAALPFDGRSDGVHIAADNFYNPFGVDFGAGTARDFRTRFTSLGQRRSYYTTNTSQAVAGLEGFVGQTWKWDAAINYGHYESRNSSYGYVDYASLADALGPSFRDTDGVVKCGAAGAIISGCVPLNIFNIDDPQTIATLQQYQAIPDYSTRYINRSFEANASGELFSLPAGAVQLAFGASYREETQDSGVSYIALAQFDEDGNIYCVISGEACSTPNAGSFDVTELYGELYVPILSELPFAHQLAVTLGTRYSDYSLFGDTTNSKLQVEWRPIENLLLRGTVAEVFRAPSINDLYAGSAANSPTAIDICAGYGRASTPLNHENACGAPTGATNIDPATGIINPGLSQVNAITSGANLLGYNLQPEEGKSFDWGVVYDPQWLPGLSLSLDYWRMYLDNTITNLAANTVLNACYADDSSPTCSLISRYDDGQIRFIREPVVNLGRLDVKGWDLALRYKLPDTAWGSWLFGLDATYIARYDNNTLPGGPEALNNRVAGTYSTQYGNLARNRGRLFANWQKGDMTASWRVRYVGGFDIESSDAGCSLDNPQFCGVKTTYSDYFVHSFQMGYSLPWFNSKVEIGLDNAFDKQPPMMYQNNVLNANTDVQTFDTLGRYLWARYTVNF